MHITGSLTGLLLLAQSLAIHAAADDWQLTRQNYDIRVYKRTVDGSSIEEFKAVAEVDSPIEIIGEVLRDIPSYPAWYVGCTETRLLEQQDRNHFTFYFRQKAPWPLRPRDLVLRVDTDVNLVQGWVEISVKSLADPVPPKIGIVRARMQGSYRLEYITRHRTRITHMLWADPAGSVASSLANRSMGERMVQILRGIKKRARHPKYNEQLELSEDKQLIERLLEEGVLQNRLP
jgi:hypothetical protein